METEERERLASAEVQERAVLSGDGDGPPPQDIPEPAVEQGAVGPSEAARRILAAYSGTTSKD